MKKYTQEVFSRLSLQSKQRLVIISTSVICILFASSTFFFNDYVFTRKNFEREIAVLMELININSVAPLYFGDTDAAQEVLSSLKASSDIVAAAGLYAADGTLFAGYVRKNDESDGGENSLLPRRVHDIPMDDRRNQVREVRFKGEIIGKLYFINDLTRYNRLLLWYTSLTLIIAMVSIMIAVFMSSYLKRLVLGPVFHLLKVVQMISSEKNFSIRASQFHGDEMGELIHGFNDMIETIQSRDKELELNRRTLEKNVEDRTVDLVKANSQLTGLNRDLMAAKKRAEKANSAKSDFLASMSHELRTPLNGILGYAQLFQKFDTNLSQDEKERMGVIHDCGEHLLEMINDILDLSKVEAGKMEIIVHRFPLSEFIQNTVAIARSKAQEKGLDVGCRFSKELQTYVMGDDQRIRQVLLNLLSNAVKFTDQGGIVLVVERLGNGFIRFAVEDTGEGIPESLLEEIFKSFTQVGDIHHKSEGTGLGLAISRKLVNLMGGTLQVKSTLGKGSRFWFDLLLESSGDQTDLKKDDFDFNSVTGYRRSDGQHGPMKVLIVDDIPDNRSLLIDSLESLGFETFEATNGKEAVDTCAGKGFDLILMDIVMPVMDGIEASKRILRGTGEFVPKIIAVSASTNADMETQILEAGCARLIIKPIQLGGLLKALEGELSLVWEKEVLQVEPGGESLDTLSDQEFAELSKMAEDGDISAILEWCTAASPGQIGDGVIVRKIETLARQFKINEIKGLLAMDPKGE